MPDVATATKAVPVWLDLSSSDAEGSRTFYSSLFGWSADVNPDPQYGGYAVCRLDGKDVAGIGPHMEAGQPTAWTIYIGTPDAAATGQRVEKAGGTVVVPGMEVGPQGTMAVYRDPAGAFISVWQPGMMTGFGVTGQPNSFGWAELNARGLENAIAFYQEVFSWTVKTSPFGEGQTYTEFQLDGTSIAGAMEMSPMVPAEVPSYWMAYFLTADVEGATSKAESLGARVIMGATEYPGGKFSIIQDPQGGVFGLMSSES